MKVLKIVFVIMCVYCSYVPTDAQDRSHELVFTNGDIYKADVDSGVTTQLTDTPVYESAPIWSPDGTQITYIAAITDDYYGQYGLYVINEDGSDATQIADDLMWRSEALWLRDGSALIYATSPVEGGDCIIKSVKRDGSDAHEMLHKPSSLCNVPNLNPMLSPDGTQLILGLDEQGNGLNTQLYSLNLTNGALTQLTHNRATNSAPQWSPDGTQIVFVSNQEGLFQIYAMDADGSNQHPLTHRNSNNFGPYWLPDSEHIVFQSDQHGYNIFELDVTKGVVRNLTNLTDSGAWGMVLSPDGTRIAYLTGEDPVAGADHISVMALASGDVHVLSDIQNKAYSLGWYGLNWQPLPKENG